jgi:hypothetical protein
MTGTPEDISSTIPFIKLVETNPCLSISHKKFQDRFNQFGMEENCSRIK